MIKANLLKLMLVLGLVLSGVQTAGAYTFTYVSGGFSSLSEVTDLITDSKWDQSDAITYAGYGDMYGGGYGESKSDTPTSISVILKSYAGATSSGNGYSAESDNRTANDTGDPGVYFQITGGTDGDLVQINYVWHASISNSDGGSETNSTLSGGGETAPMFISLNGAYVWEQDATSAGMDSDPVYNDTGFFMAHVGDIIGINLAAYSKDDFSTGTDLYSEAYNSMKLEIVPLPPTVVLLGSGLLGLLGLQGFRSRRR